MRKVAGGETGFTSGQFDFHRRLAGNFIRHVRHAQCNEKVVVAMAMQKCRGLRRHFDLENSYVLVLKKKMVRWLRSNFYLRTRGIGGEQWDNHQRGDDEALHAAGL